MAYIALGDNQFDCSICHTRCDGKSKGVYLFEHDTTFSERYEQAVIEKINRKEGYVATKHLEHSYPDIEVRLNGDLHRYVEVKVQQRTFMSVQKILPASNLCPSETVALNLSDLLRYFAIERETKIPTVIVWVLLNRPCIVGATGQHWYYQTSNLLQQVYERAGDQRRFKRLSGQGDVVDGVHKGVTVNYHFSLNELRHWR